MDELHASLYTPIELVFDQPEILVNEDEVQLVAKSMVLV